MALVKFKPKKTHSREVLMRRIQNSEVAARRAREKSARVVEGVVDAAVASGAAFGVSFASAKMGGEPGVSIGPVDLELAVGAGALALGLTGLGGGASKYLLSAANGAFCAWASNQGRAAALASAGAAVPRAA